MAIRTSAAVGFLVVALLHPLGAEPGPAGSSPPAVTNGLIHWWPNLFDARDVVSGQEGVVIGVVPPIADEQAAATEFGVGTGWVQLQPALTNRSFTLAFWMKRGTRPWLADTSAVVAQYDGLTTWTFRRLDATENRYAIVTGNVDPPEREEFVTIPAEGWHHVVLAMREDGRALIWLDGALQLDGHLRHETAPKSRWLSVGNTVKGDEQWSGSLRDLRAYDRLLRPEEVRALHAAGLPECPPHPTAARLAATAPTEFDNWQTNVTPVPGGELIHRRYTTEDGLADNVVQAVLQTADGYLWVGSERGLSRFDGRKFEVFNAENTPALRVTDHDIISLAEDGNGSLWISTYGGLVRFRAGTFTACTNGLPERFVVRAEPADAGCLWVAGFRSDDYNRGPCQLRRFHPGDGRTEAVVTVPGQPIRLVPVTNGVWVATEKPEALYFWDGRSATVTATAVIGSGPPSLAMGGKALPPGSHCRGWVNPSNGSERWVELQLGSGGPKFHWVWWHKRQRPGVARWQGADRSGAWLASTVGLALCGPERLRPVAFPEWPSPPEISCACANREGGLWFGTEEDGLHLVQERLVQVFTTRDGLGADEVRVVSNGIDGQLWAGTSRRQNGRWQTLLPGTVNAVAQSDKGDLWTGWRYTGNSSITFLPPNATSREEAKALELPGLGWGDPNTLRFATDGTLWIACSYGVTWIKPPCLRGGGGRPDANQYGRFATGRELPEAIPLGLVEDPDGGSLWVGTMRNGLIQIHGQRVTRFTREDGLAGDYCVPALAEKGGVLWVVTENGISRRKDGRFRSILPRDGLPEDLVSGLVEDDSGHFWLPGKRGIHCVVRSDVEAFLDGRTNHVHHITLGLRDGMLTPECSTLNFPTAARTPDGRIWVATRKGVAMINPNRVRFDLQPIPPLLQRLVTKIKTYPLPEVVAARNGPAPSPKPLRLPAGSGHRVQFDFTGISFTAADRVRFKYRLDGYDADWNPETDLRLALYTNLRPGNYRFRVKAANAHGVWSEEEATQAFAIAPHFWETGTFGAAVVLAIGVAALWLHRQRLSVMHRLQALKHDQVLANEKARIAADMHDELGATLTQIVLLGESARTQVADPQRTGASLARIANAARDVTARMSELIWVINPRHDTLDNLAAYLREHAARQFDGTSIRTRLEFHPPSGECHVSATFRRNLVLVVKEALHNVLKHSGATELHCQLAATGNGIDIRIEDNGRGFDVPSRTGAGNGLGNMLQRVRDLGGTLEIDSAPGQGTRVHLSAPLSAAKPAV